MRASTQVDYLGVSGDLHVAASFMTYGYGWETAGVECLERLKESDSLIP